MIMSIRQSNLNRQCDQYLLRYLLAPQGFRIADARNGFCFRNGAVVMFITSNKGAKEILAETLISPCDLERLLTHGRWSLIHHEQRDCNAKAYPYAHCRLQYLHRFIMDAPDGLFVDHINGNTLDNRRENLRFVTHTQNMQNSTIPRNNQSGVRNVHWQSQSGKWAVQITANGKKHHLGLFEDFDVAARVAESARIKYQSHSPDNSGYPERADSRLSKGVTL